VTTVDAAHRPCKAVWWYHPASRTAIIESARVVGLAMMPEGRFHPFDLDTFGLAEVFREAAKAGARRCVAGIGGSATNDGGAGLARGLGWRFLDDAGAEITRPGGLEKLAAVEPAVSGPRFDELVVAVDVKNPLLGPQGCSRIFGPQKGLRPEDMTRAEAGLERLADLTQRATGRDARGAMGAGSAGGLGFGLQAFLGAKPVEGFELFAEAADLPAQLSKADLVITGEGRVDASSVMGKAAGSLARMCRERGIPCIALAGVVSDREVVDGHFLRARGLVEIVGESQAKAEAARWLRTLAEGAARDWAG
jgi:glycerate kinase